jgi:hypothetical protein
MGSSSSHRLLFSAAKLTIAATTEVLFRERACGAVSAVQCRHDVISWPRRGKPHHATREQGALTRARRGSREKEQQRQIASNWLEAVGVSVVLAHNRQVGVDHRPATVTRVGVKWGQKHEKQAARCVAVI